MAVLQVYLDESGKQSDHALIAICCVCAPARKIDKFGDDWNGLLRQYGVAEFHMKRASQYSRSWGKVPKQTLDDRIEALKPFADCIGDNLELGIIQAWDVKGFKEIPPQFRAKIGNVQDPYYIAFVRALLELSDYAKGDDVLSIVCDYDIATAWECYRHYLGVRKAHEGVRRKTASISFADDKFFPALQAADMVAFLTRHEARDEFYGIHNKWLGLFNCVVRERETKMQWQKMFADEQKAKTCLKAGGAPFTR
ncbi:MAG: DUF3800 domain-containing protein [Candidatus Acidiferrales bacterium]